MDSSLPSPYRADLLSRPMKTVTRLAHYENLG